MDLLLLIIAGAALADLLFTGWYLWEACISAYSARRQRRSRRVRFQTLWRASTQYGDELDDIITK